REDHSYTMLDEIGCQCRQTIVIAFCPTILDGNIAAFRETSLIETAPEAGEERLPSAGGPATQESDDWHRRLLRARREGPRCRRAPKQRDELAPLHSISSSARDRNDAGTVKPSFLAALRLMTNSNLASRSTGSSLGLAPLRIRPT